jgi:creatinine amidohydrolase
MTPAQWAEIHGERGTSALGHGADPLTSVYLHLFPELVRMDLIEMKDKKSVLGLPPSGLNAVKFDGVDVNLAVDIDDISDTGIAGGDPNNSSAEIGEKIVETLVDFAARFVAHFKGVDTKTS